MSKIDLLAVAGAAGVLFAAGSAHAQFGPTLDEHTTVVEELVVRGFGGPPWWKVSDADSTLYILADPGALPPGVEFDQRLLERRVGAAKTVIVSPRFSLGLGMIMIAPKGLKLLSQLNGSTVTRLEPSLPPDVRTRFVAARTAIGQPETRYGALTPGVAGMALAGDVEAFRQSKVPPAPKGSRTAEGIVMDVAKTKRVKVIPSANFGSSLFGEFLDQLKRPGMTCLNSSLDAVEKPAAPPRLSRQREVVEAWAEGDVRPLLNNSRSRGSEAASANLNLEMNKKSVHLRMSTPACMDAMPVVVRMKTQYITDQVDTLQKVMGKPGQAVAVLDAGTLLMTGGILDQLRHKGFTVTAPDVAARD